jgi:hypothetical protein
VIFSPLFFRGLRRISAKFSGKFVVPNASRTVNAFVSLDDPCEDGFFCKRGILTAFPAVFQLCSARCDDRQQNASNEKKPDLVQFADRSNRQAGEWRAIPAQIAGKSGVGRLQWTKALPPQKAL